ncbi:MAG: hypothetical protein QOH29_1720 [Actinomycetota bacterium]|jgi:hypothetical protein|nr:hypothetical protein [Actinomycetota bacterium]
MAASSGPAFTGVTAVAAFLRVYEPLEAFPADERASWRAVAAAGPVPAAEIAAREHAAAIRALTALPPRVVTDLDVSDDAESPVGIVLNPPAPDGRLRICPLELAWRSLLALEEFQTDVAPSLLPAFVPADVVGAASRELARLVLERSTLTGPHVRSSRWAVPLTWFAAFQPSHRQAGPPPESPRDDPAVPAHQEAVPAHQEHEADAERPRPAVRQPAPTLRFVAPMADARRCVARAIASVRVNPTPLLPANDLEEVGRWLEEFHARSVVELDYGGLGRLIGDDALAADDSVTELSLGLADLRADRAESGVARLAAVRDHWDEIRAFEHAS